MYVEYGRRENFLDRLDDKLSIPIMVSMLEKIHAEIQWDSACKDLAPALAHVIRELTERRRVAEQVAKEVEAERCLAHNQ